MRDPWVRVLLRRECSAGTGSRCRSACWSDPSRTSSSWLLGPPAHHGFDDACDACDVIPKHTHRGERDLPPDSVKTQRGKKTLRCAGSALPSIPTAKHPFHRTSLQRSEASLVEVRKSEGVDVVFQPSGTARRSFKIKEYGGGSAALLIWSVPARYVYTKRKPSI